MRSRVTARSSLFGALQADGSLSLNGALRFGGSLCHGGALTEAGSLTLLGALGIERLLEGPVRRTDEVDVVPLRQDVGLGRLLAVVDLVHHMV